MEKIYSRKEPDKILQILFSKSDIPSNHEKSSIQEFSPSESGLQILGHFAPKGHVVKPHFHNALDRITKLTNEGIIILEGKIELTIYDLDNSPIETRTLIAGDGALILQGGHKFVVGENAKFFEFKNGPYMGKTKDLTEIKDY